ncbi:MAG: DUF1289 domain-containing protein [Burkholderiales bacterium]|nr:DUF1289 domain-containing protein [Burkholderiales bacterium]
MDAIEMLAERAILARAAVENVPSPCISVCSLDGSRSYCEGCLRSLDEIRMWSSSSDAQKKDVWARIEERIAHRNTTP